MREEFLSKLPAVLIPFRQFEGSKWDYRDWLISAAEDERPIDSLTVVKRDEDQALMYCFFFVSARAAAAFKLRWG